MVSVLMITYNHEKFIDKAIESIICQQTNFNIELVIGEDHSTDQTHSKCKEWEHRFPDKIRVVRSEQNIGVSKNVVFTYGHLTGTYVAICEGDDYWTDSNKLQKQVDYLESNLDASGCFHDSITINERDEIISNSYFPLTRSVYDSVACINLLRSSYATCSLVFRKIDPLPDWFQRRACDYFLDLLITDHGQLHYLQSNMSAYRIHSGGIWQGDKRAVGHSIEMVKRLRILLRYWKRYELELLRELSSHLYTIILKGNITHSFRFGFLFFRYYQNSIWSKIKIFLGEGILCVKKHG